MKILLQHKIFIGYFLLMVIIGSMVAIILHERNRVQKIEVESISIFQTQHNINTAHRYVTALVTYGESVLVWDNEAEKTHQSPILRKLIVSRISFSMKFSSHPAISLFLPIGIFFSFLLSTAVTIFVIIE